MTLSSGFYLHNLHQLSPSQITVGNLAVLCGKIPVFARIFIFCRYKSEAGPVSDLWILNVQTEEFENYR